MVLYAGVISSMDAQMFKDPESFVPERWIRGCPHYKKVDAFASLPFGHGPRSCIGQRFARLELYLVAFRMVQRFKMEYDNEPIGIDYTGVGHPDRDVQIRLTSRN